MKYQRVLGFICIALGVLGLVVLLSGCNEKTPDQKGLTGAQYVVRIPELTAINSRVTQGGRYD